MGELYHVLNQSWAPRPDDGGIRIAVGDSADGGLHRIYELGDSVLDSSDVDQLTWTEHKIFSPRRVSHHVALDFDRPPAIGSPVQRWDAQRRDTMKGKSLARVPRKPAAERRYLQRARPQSAPLHEHTHDGGLAVRQPWELSLNDPVRATTKVQQFWKSSSSTSRGGGRFESSNMGIVGKGRPNPASSRPSSAASNRKIMEAPSRPPSAVSVGRPSSASSTRPQTANGHAPSAAVDENSNGRAQVERKQQRPSSALPGQRQPQASSRPSSAAARLTDMKRDVSMIRENLIELSSIGKDKPDVPLVGNGREEDFDEVEYMNLVERDRTYASDTRQRNYGQVFVGGEGRAGAAKAPRKVESDEVPSRHRNIAQIQSAGIMGTSSPLSKAAYGGAAMPRRVDEGETKEQKLEVDSRLEALYGSAGDWLQDWKKEYETESHCFQSLELFCQVKMLEILGSETLNAVGDPNQFKTAVVCDMLGRLCAISGTLEGVLTRLRTELMRSIYVEYKDDTSPFAMKPYFVAAATSAGDCKDAFRERDALLNQINEKNEKIIEQKRVIRELREESQTAKLDAAWTKTKVDKLEVQIAQNRNAKGFMSQEEDDIFQDLTEKIKKLTFDLAMAEKMHEGAQGRMVELEHEVTVSKIRASSAEKEWKEASDNIDSLKREMASMRTAMRKMAKMAKSAQADSVAAEETPGGQYEVQAEGGEGTGATAKSRDENVPVDLSLQHGDDIDKALIAWVDSILGKNEGDESRVSNVDKDFSDSHFYLTIFSHIFPDNHDARQILASAETCLSREERAEVVVKLFHQLLHCYFVEADAIVGKEAWPHRVFLLELLAAECRQLERQAATSKENNLQLKSTIQGMHDLRTRAVGKLTGSVLMLERKVKQQGKALASFNFVGYDEETLMGHVQFSLDFDSLRPCMSPLCTNESEGDSMLFECLDHLNEVRPNLRAVFRYYCKLSEPDEDDEGGDAVSREASMEVGDGSGKDGEDGDGGGAFLEGLDTMDLDEFRKVLGHAKYSIPGLTEVTQIAFDATMKIGPGEVAAPGIGMGAIQFEECLVRMCALIAYQWNPRDKKAEAKQQPMTMPIDILVSMVDKHILVFCERMHQLDFSSELSKDGIPELWDLYSKHLNRVFSLYATLEAGTALSVGDFLCIMKDLGVTGPDITPPKMIEIFTMTQVIVAGSSQNETMSVDEFQEALSACAVYKDPSPYLSLSHKIQVRPLPPLTFHCHFSHMVPSCPAPLKTAIQIVVGCIPS
jgi:hypothetical protein